MTRKVAPHSSWEDMLGMLLGIAILFTPWFTGYPVDSKIALTTAGIGILVFVLAAMELVSLRRWEEFCQLLLGLALIGLPFIYGYTDTLRTWHFVLGFAVAALALVELAQDWNVSDEELAGSGPR